MSWLLEDRELQEAFRRGERAALEKVYRSYLRPLYAMLSRGFPFESGGCRRFFKGFSDPSAIEEAVQEVFLRAFAPAARLAYDGLTPYRNYLFTIARNILIDSIRLGGRHASVEVVEVESEAPEQGAVLAHPENDVDHAELVGHCERFIASLEPLERRLFEARFREGLSVEEAARCLRISEHHVKRGEKSLRKRFFHVMKAHGYFEGFRYGRAGLEKVACLFALALGVLR